jgi:hypothetical protein
MAFPPTNSTCSPRTLTQVTYILEILIQHKTTMRQQHNEVDEIWSQVDSLQVQSTSDPMVVETTPSASGSSPPVNIPAQDMGKEEMHLTDQTKP